MARHVIPYPAHPRFRADQGFIQIDLQESSEDKRGHRRHRSPFPHPTCTRRLSTIPSPRGRPRGESCHRAALGRGRIGEDPAHSGVESCRRIRSSPRGPMDSIALDSQTGGDGSSWPTSIRKDPPATVSTRSRAGIRRPRHAAAAAQLSIERHRDRDRAGMRSPSPVGI
ncbi:hypothetical protein FHT76_008046 [Rhizobium sp. BK176]|nr:hypothetical protein [Rhizobium sp. BK399]MCS4096325.1 hypothetical protein [Rhizobium sp. BK176]